MTIKEILKEFNDGKTHIYTKEEEIEIFNYLDNNPKEKELVQTILLTSNKGLILSICRKYHPICECDFDDIVQFANIGLIRAIDKFDITKDTKFSSYATFWIKQTINRELQKLSSKISAPIRASEIRRKYYEVEDKLTQLYKREATFYEIANKMGINYNDLALILALADSKVISLNKETDDDELINFVKDKDDEFSEKREMIFEALKLLDKKEKDVIYHRYGFIDGMYHTMEETGVYLSCTRQRVQQIEKQALRTMKNYLRNKKNN